MAAYPHIQDWVREEVKQVFPDGIRFEDWDYKKFPELKRCLAVMVSPLYKFKSTLTSGRIY